MSLPPFPVPRGMEWDPVKKRFFKAPPARAKVEAKRPSSEGNGLGRQEPLPPPPLAPRLLDPPAGSPSRLPVYSRSGPTSHSGSQKVRQAATRASFCRLKHVSTTTLIPWMMGDSPFRLNHTWKLGIRSLHCLPHLGSLMYFTNGANFLNLLDTSHITCREDSHAIAHFFHYLPRPLAHQSFPPTDIDWHYVKLVSDHQMPSHKTDTHCLSAVSNRRLATVHDATLSICRIGGREVLEFEDKDLKEHLEGHSRRSHFRKELAKLKVKRDQIQLLCIREGTRDGFTVLAYATQRQVGILRHGKEGKPNVLAFQHMESDVISLEILPSSSAILVGLRNGKVLLYPTKQFIKRRRRGEKDGGSLAREAAIELEADEGLTYSTPLPPTPFTSLVEGAVTNIIAVSEQEVVVAYSSGSILLLDMEYPRAPLMRFEGHVNSWSLDLPVTVDSSYRLLAAAGQDRRVRLWSLDHPLPLQPCPGDDDALQTEAFDLAQGRLSNRLLQRTTFAAPIAGLAFCQRRSIANAEGRMNEEHLTRGIPGLAVSCHGNEIGFYE